MLYSICVDYQWDQEKAASNLEKHGVAFEEVTASERRAYEEG